MKLPASKWLAAGLSATLLAFVASMEGQKQDAYPDLGKGWALPTICVGHTANVKRGDHATVEQCQKYLNADMLWAGKNVARCVRAPLTEGQFDALVSFEFNTGRLCGSHLVELVNAGNCHGAAKEFNAWNKAGGKVLPGLVRRRAAESAMFEKGCD